MSKKIIIVGAKGMLGKDLVAVYGQDQSNQVYAWDLLDINISDREAVFEKIKAIGPDMVINAAAYNAVDQAEEEEGFKIAQKVNAQGPENLAGVCKEIQAIFVTYSSDYVFRGDKKEGYSEDDKPDPISKYGLSKYEGEKKVQIIGGKYYIIRTSKLFGETGTGENVKKSFISVMQELSEKMPELKVVDEEMSCFTYTPDLARATKSLLEGSYSPGIYHIANGDPCTWYECAKNLFKILGKNIKLIPVPASEFPRPAKRPQYSVLLNTKLPPLRSYKDALREFLNAG